MRTTVTLDDQLLADAQELTGIAERSSLLREGLRALVERGMVVEMASASNDPQKRYFPASPRKPRSRALPD